ncbi:succinate dehydrogenase assembly factor 2 [Rickettsiaceae bacterium]|nr:succinate dehydrogenase assembly factor 2 [Rickettsiaceae bacterium]
MKILNRELFIKKLLYQSCNRGCKETDLIIGNFAKNHIREMTDQELHMFQKILHLPDTNIYDWYTKKKSVPLEHSSEIMNKILNFKP